MRIYISYLSKRYLDKLNRYSRNDIEDGLFYNFLSYKNRLPKHLIIVVYFDNTTGFNWFFNILFISVNLLLKILYGHMPDREVWTWHIVDRYNREELFIEEQ